MLASLIGPVVGLLDKFIEDKDQKNKLAHEIATMAQKHAHEANMGQIDINKNEANHRSIWVAGWRPACGWICAAALGWHFILQPIVLFLAAVFNIVLPVPSFDMGSLMTVLMGMLGLGSLRTFEKQKGVTK